LNGLPCAFRRAGHKKIRSATGGGRFGATEKFSPGATDIRRSLVQQGTGARSDGSGQVRKKEATMRKTIFGIVAAVAMLGMVPMANAAQGCGPGWHRGPYGRCHPNRRPVVIVPGRLVIGTYYPGRGWWDGHRYWVHRYHWHHGWRYR